MPACPERGGIVFRKVTMYFIRRNVIIQNLAILARFCFFANLIKLILFLRLEKAEGYEQRLVDAGHHIDGKFTDFFFQSAFVEGADLLQ